MASKLKNPEVTKVDFVNEGANPDAHIMIYKKKDVADGSKITEPEQPEAKQNEKGGIWKRFIHSVAKAVGMGDSDIQHIIEDVEKGNSVTFAEELNERKNRKIADEIWDLCFALQSSLCSILNDENMDTVQASNAMQESLEQFTEVMEDSVTQWCTGRTVDIVKKDVLEVTPGELEVMKSARDRISEVIEKASEKSEQILESEKGEPEEMKINKSKLTPSELAFLESIEKRYGCGEAAGGDASGDAGTNGGDGTESATAGGTTPTVEKSLPQENVIPAAQEPQISGGNDDIYKGLHPQVAEELKDLKKYKEQKEAEELEAVANKYAVIGKKKDELVPMFKNLKAAGGTAYDDMIAVLDQAVEAVEKSGVFGEIGKSGGNSSGNGAEAKISDIAKGYIAKDPSLDYNVAVAKAWENNPDIMAEYEEQEGF